MKRYARGQESHTRIENQPELAGNTPREMAGLPVLTPDEWLGKPRGTYYPALVLDFGYGKYVAVGDENLLAPLMEMLRQQEEQAKQERRECEQRLFMERIRNCRKERPNCGGCDCYHWPSYYARCGKV